MVRISVDVVNDSYQFINPVRQREICLRNLQIPSIENLAVTKDQFDVIDLSDNNIRKLDNLPVLKRLESLVLHNNRIQQIEEKIGDHLPMLNTLVLTNNNIAELGDLDPLAKCGKLEYLSLIGNPVTHNKHYRQYVIYKLKSVRVLDFRRIKDVERNAARALFKGSKGAQLREEVVKQSENLMEDEESIAARAASHIKARSEQEQQKIRDLIKGAKTLAEVENLTNMLQQGRIPGERVPHPPHQSMAATTGGFEPEEEEAEGQGEDAQMGGQQQENANKQGNGNGAPQPMDTDA